MSQDQGAEKGEGVTLKACPFCASDSVTILTKLEDDLGEVFIPFCRNCAASAPGHLNRDCAIEAWNTRRAESRAQEGSDFIQGRCGHVRLKSEKECPACKAADSETADEYLDRIILDYGATIAAKMRAKQSAQAADAGGDVVERVAIPTLTPEQVHRLVEHDNATSWLTTCMSCARAWDTSYADYMRAEQAEKERDQARAEVEAMRAALRDIRHTLGNHDPQSSLSVLDRLQADLDIVDAAQQVIEVCDTIDHALGETPPGERAG